MENHRLAHLFLAVLPTYTISTFYPHHDYDLFIEDIAVPNIPKNVASF